LGGNKANIMHAGEATIGGTPRKIHLKLTRELLRQRMTQVKLGKTARVYRHIRMFCGTAAREKAGRDIAYRVATRFARGQADTIQTSQKGWYIIK